LADIVGLLVVASIFAGTDEGEGWLAWGRDQLIAEMRHQVNGDGTSHEASTAYHRLVLEMFARGSEVAEAHAGPLPAWFMERLNLMRQFVLKCERPDHLWPLVGDSDDGRFLPLGDYGATDPRRFEDVPSAHAPQSSERQLFAFPDGGYVVLSERESYVLFRCGETGMQGRGPHAHNDQLSLEVACGMQPILVDPGTYVYTADAGWRNRFRSTGWHSTLGIDGVEQNPLDRDLFLLPDGTQARLGEVSADGSMVTVAGHHDGYSHLPAPARHIRRVSVETDAKRLWIEDVVESGGPHDLEWCFTLAPADVEIDGACITARFPTVLATFRCSVVEWRLEPGFLSARYGVKEQTTFLRASKRSHPGADRTVFELHLQPL
jgi:hypothetical protein